MVGGPIRTLLGCLFSGVTMFRKQNYNYLAFTLKCKQTEARANMGFVLYTCYTKWRMYGTNCARLNLVWRKAIVRSSVHGCLEIENTR